MATKKSQKQARKYEVLMGLMELFLVTGRAVGSQVLKNEKFHHISSATIRNYCARLEEEGLLKQQHASGGRIPTLAAYKLYATHHLTAKEVDPKEEAEIKEALGKESREVGRFLQSNVEFLSHLTQGAAFLSSPRFDQDLIIDMKLVELDRSRCLGVVLTNFGMVRSEILYPPKKMSRFAIKRIESYFHFRLTGLDRPTLSKEEEEIGLTFYNELMMRHIVAHSNFTEQDIYKTGFSKLIQFPEFQDPTVLANSLSIFENGPLMQGLLASCMAEGDLKVWIGDDLAHPSAATAQSSIIAVPYAIRGKVVGAIALLGPVRMPYAKLFALLRAFAQLLSERLTQTLHKYKITYREAEQLRVEGGKLSDYILKIENKL